MSQNYLSGREVIIEMIPIGNYVQVKAMDSKTLTEVTTQGPRSTPETTLRRNAIRRLEYVLKKKGLI